MPPLQTLSCRLKGHIVACSQEATLLPDGGGILSHRHECLKCGMKIIYADEPLPPEVDQMLRMQVYPGKLPLMVAIEPVHQHNRLN